MKSNQVKIKRTVQFALLIAVVTTTWACTGNSGTTAGNDTDSSDVDAIIVDNNTNGNDETNRMMNDSAGYTNGNTSTDAAFMIRAAEMNVEEIKLGRLAQQKGTAAHVKDLGKMMVTGHEQALTGMTAMAKSKMVNLPTAESGTTTSDYNTLTAKSGKDFDIAYSDMMVNAHKEAIALFEKTARETQDPEVKAMTGNMIPKLKTHLQHSEMCQKECRKS